MGRETPKRVYLSLLLALHLAACGGDDTVSPDPSVTPFVGTWDAEVFTVTPDAEPTIVANLLDFGTFSITVEPSGQYTATLLVMGQPSVEFGQLIVVSASTLRLQPDNADPATSSYTFTADDYVVLDGATEFDFNFDEVDEAAQAHIELRRRP